VVSAALAFATAASAAYWSWGFNYLGNVTSSGDCLWADPFGQVCSGWNYWDDNGLDDRGGGAVSHGFINNNQASYYTRCCAGFWMITPSDVGMGGYLKSYASWESGEASYLKVDSFA
jgi:hypothetical protein